ncbi:MAG: hypothetical protein WAL35_06620 [Acidimicrobiales bacterium]
MYDQNATDVTPVRSKESSLKLYRTDLLMPLAIVLWAIGVHETNPKNVGSYGLVTALPITVYLGVGLLVVSFIVALRREGPETWRMALHAVAMVVMLYAIAPLVYPESRYPWFYKTVGVVQYVNAHGQLNRSIDIYQNWPGFFAAAAWFDKVAGVASPLAFAKWAQPVFELAALPLLYVIFVSLGLTVRQRWMAILLYVSCKWIAEDYSPQGIGTLLSLGVLALACRWLLTDRIPRRRRRDQPIDSSTSPPPASGTSRVFTHEIAAVCVVLTLIYFVLTFTHELSPYIVVMQLGALAVAGLMRPRWLPLVLAAIAIGYLLPRLSFVDTKYGLLDSFGAFFSNAAPPSVNGGLGATSAELLIERSAELLSAFIWGLALLGIWVRRREGRPVLALAILAFSPALVLLLGAYGNEGSQRVFLFSLPWSAALASSVLVPKGVRARVLALRRSPRPPRDFRLLHMHAEEVSSANAKRYVSKRRPVPGMARSGVALVVASALFFPAFYGNDAMYMMTPSEVSTVTWFLRTATPGPVYVGVDFLPFADTARYNLFPTQPVFGPGGVIAENPVASSFANAVTHTATSYTGGNEPAYVIVTPSMLPYIEAYRLTPARNLARLVSELARSRAWKLVVQRAGTVIYELPAAYRSWWFSGRGP